MSTPPVVKHLGRPKGSKDISPEDLQAMRDMAAEGWGWGAIARKFDRNPIYVSCRIRGKRGPG